MKYTYTYFVVYNTIRVNSRGHFEANMQSSTVIERDKPIDRVGEIIDVEEFISNELGDRFTHICLINFKLLDQERVEPPDIDTILSNIREEYVNNKDAYILSAMGSEEEVEAWSRFKTIEFVIKEFGYTLDDLRKAGR
ncbi:hypothetical protein [Geomicrobium sp. JCM 19055]|uniref:hypothetical protein n=1 Tax=Geomicrobium sp. JCM 19055 TaxID=1460649 RepID=UPI0005A6E020|nr:hypothetical protein [Geomicrobium sp. JCM 19055]